MDPERIGPYIIEHRIGSGGMGTVYLAHHAETNEEVAVKVLPPALAREEGFVARFEREIESLRKLVNPHIVKLRASGAEENTPYYAMEYVEGETLTDRLRREKKLPWRDVVQYSLQICSALKSAHDAGIIHRDLKPSNLLLDKDNNIKLTDFGVAQVFASGRLTMTGGIIGTAEYMSPEQAHGKRATKKSDLYSLGAVMYTMLTGRPPFVGKTTLEVIHKHKYGTFDRPSLYVEGVPRRLEEIICQLLEKEPEKRFPDALVLAKKLEEILRRADVADQDETRIAETGATPNAQSAEVHVAGDSRQPLNDIGGTFVRDMVLADVEQTLTGSPLSRFFNNTWVLLGIFVLLIAGGIFWFQMMNDNSEAQAENSERPTENQAFFKARTLLEGHLRASEPNEADPFLRQAIHALELGDAARAERLLLSLKFAIEDEDGQRALLLKVNEALKNLDSIKPPENTAKTPSLIPRKLVNEAESLWNRNDKAKAVMLWKSIIEVYGDDPLSQKEVYEAKRRLNESEQVPLPIEKP
jgi:serine/threonine-protein kinase